jgi:hypothetical protein
MAMGDQERDRLHSLIFGMLYPALHGAFLLAQFTSSGPAHLPPWGALLTVYFAAQFVEGMAAREGYNLRRGIVNLIEIALMALIFAALNYFPDAKPPEAWRNDAAIAGMIFLAFILPAAHRIIFARLTLRYREPSYLFARSVTIMSIAAAIASLFIRSWLAWSTVLVILLTYMLFFQFANDWLVRKLQARGKTYATFLKRPQ